MSGLQRPPAVNNNALPIRPDGASSPQAPGSFAAPLRFVRWGSLVLGLVFIAASGILALSSQDFASRALPAEGTVVRLTERDGSYTPIFRFRTHDGRDVEVIHSVSSNPPMWRAGQPLRLLYDPQDPQSAIPDSWTSIWLFPLIFGVVGLNLLITFVVLSVMNARARSAPAQG